jgi:hypothetical protein
MVFCCVVTIACTLLSVTVAFGLWDIKAIVFVQGGAGLSMVNTVAAIIVTCFPVFTFSYLFSGVLCDGYNAMGIYAIIRLHSKTKWLVIKLVQICAIVLLYHCVSYCGAALILLSGKALDIWLTSLEVFLWLLPLNVLMSCAVLFLTNLIGIRYGSSLGFLAIVPLHLISIFLCSGIAAGAVKPLYFILPSAQGVFTWHDNAVVNEVFSGATIKGFSLEYSYIYLFVLVMLILFISCMRFKKTDLLQ